ncbi:MAG TPA: type II secretion system protein, partial [Patescibacteria group bacterium]|nr:type II secretion system protein [Patescibacteria group bacterium]
MQTRYTTTKHPTGITLIETLISLAIFIMVSSAFYLLIQLGLRTLTDDQIRLDAIAIAQSQIESLRNVPYDDVGTIEGIPHGV